MSQHSEIRKHIESGKSLTQLQALKQYGCFRLAPIIGRLEKAGMSIDREAIGRRRYAKYKLA